MRPRSVVLLVGMVLFATACGTDDEVTGLSSSPDAAATPGGASAIVTLENTGCEYDGPSEMQAGELTIEMVKRTKGTFGLHVWLLNEGHTYDEFADYVAEEHRRLTTERTPQGAPTFAQLSGRGGAIGDTGEVALEVSPGTYGMACLQFVNQEHVGIWAAGPFMVL